MSSNLAPNRQILDTDKYLTELSEDHQLASFNPSYLPGKQTLFDSLTQQDALDSGTAQMHVAASGTASGQLQRWLCRSRTQSARQKIRRVDWSLLVTLSNCRGPEINHSIG